jgi:glycosyltransferase involved in cell wall biosynthesis
MQQLRKPVLVLNIGAHPGSSRRPAVVPRRKRHRRKALRVLAGELLTGPTWDANLDTFQQTFTWKRTIQAYAELLGSLSPVQELPVPQLVIDTSACLRDTANTGVARVVRSLTRKLQDFGRPLFVTWNESLRAYVLPTEAEYHNLALYGGPLPNPAHYVLPRSRQRPANPGELGGRQLAGGWLLQSEIVFERQGPERRRGAGAAGRGHLLRCHPCDPPEWSPISVFETITPPTCVAWPSATGCCRFPPMPANNCKPFGSAKRLPRCPGAHLLDPGELTASPRATVAAAAPRAGEPLRILCVSTLEPRKNHKVLLAAVARLAADYPQLDWQLDLIGNRYAGADHLVDAVREASVADPRIVWHGVVNDATSRLLRPRSRQCLPLTGRRLWHAHRRKPSWHARPCICHNAGVMAELAAEGGCRTVDMTDLDRAGRDDS